MWGWRGRCGEGNGAGRREQFAAWALRFAMFRMKLGAKPQHESGAVVHTDTDPLAVSRDSLLRSFFQCELLHLSVTCSF